MALQHPLLTRKFSNDFETPAAFSLVKLRLPISLPGPGSIIGSSAVSGATRRNYHSAIVRSAVLDISRGCVNMRVWAVPSYSFNPSWLATQPDDFRNLHIPMPCQQLDAHTGSTPIPFGQPLDCGGYLDRRPAWVFLREIDFDLPLTQAWKRFDPVVVIPGREIVRLEMYFNFLSRPNVSQVNLMFEPAPSSGVHDLFTRMFTDHWNQPGSHAGSDSGDEYSDHDGDERSEDAYNFLRTFGSGCSGVAEVVARRDSEKEAMRIKTVSEWRNKVLQPENWFIESECESRATGGGYHEEESDEEQERERAGL